MKKYLVAYIATSVFLTSQNAISESMNFKKVMCSENSRCGNSRLNTSGGITDQINSGGNINNGVGFINEEAAGLSKLRESSQPSSVYGGVKPPSNQRVEDVKKGAPEMAQNSTSVESESVAISARLSSILDSTKKTGIKAWSAIVEFLTKEVKSGNMSKTEANKQALLVHKLPGKNLKELSQQSQSSDIISSSVCTFFNQLLIRQNANDIQNGLIAIKQALPGIDLSSIYIFTSSETDQMAQHFLYSNKTNKFYAIEKDHSIVVEVAVPKKLSDEKDIFVFRDEDDKSLLVNATGITKVLAELNKLTAGQVMKNQDIGCSNGAWFVKRASGK